VEHPRQRQVVGEDGLAGDLRRRVDLDERLADDRERPRMRAAASSTASKILR
jgi:hypothetical protein